MLHNNSPNDIIIFVTLRAYFNVDPRPGIISNEEEKYELVIKTASGELTIEQVKKWIGDRFKICVTQKTRPAYRP
ncbi:MAG: hypothetical protein MJA30_26970 [Cytophagales bacterium]|nr:hypothetical protein [Cytophagales bacterium]